MSANIERALQRIASMTEREMCEVGARQARHVARAAISELVLSERAAAKPVAWVCMFGDEACALQFEPGEPTMGTTWLPLYTAPKGAA